MTNGLVTTVFGDVPAADAERWKFVQHYMDPILEFFQRPGVTEIMINRYNEIFVEDEQGMRKVAASFKDEEALNRLIGQIANALGQQVGESNPILHARFPDQSRACCTLRDVSPQGCSMTLRIAPKQTLTWDHLIRFGAITPTMVDYIGRAVQRAANIIISGNTGSGKTTVLRATASFIGRDERVLTAEDTQELYLDLPNQINLEAPKRKGSSVKLATLVETTLRQRPDRILIGEIRDASAADAFLQAINTGHSGCCTSMHANSPIDAIQRIQYLIASAGLIDYELAGKQLTGSINIIIQASRHHDFGRKITEIAEVIDGKVQALFKYDAASNAHLTDHKLLSQSRYQ